MDEEQEIQSLILVYHSERFSHELGKLKNKKVIGSLDINIKGHSNILVIGVWHVKANLWPYHKQTLGYAHK